MGPAERLASNLQTVSKKHHQSYGGRPGGTGSATELHLDLLAKTKENEKEIEAVAILVESTVSVC